MSHHAARFPTKEYFFDHVLAVGTFLSIILIVYIIKPEGTLESESIIHAQCKKFMYDTFYILYLPSGSMLVKVGTTELKVGQTERDFITSALTSFVHPLNRFLENEVKNATRERKTLENKR